MESGNKYTVYTSSSKWKTVIIADNLSIKSFSKVTLFELVWYIQHCGKQYPWYFNTAIIEQTIGYNVSEKCADVSFWPKNTNLMYCASVFSFTILQEKKQTKLTALTVAIYKNNSGLTNTLHKWSTKLFYEQNSKQKWYNRIIRLSVFGQTK